MQGHGIDFETCHALHSLGRNTSLPSVWINRAKEQLWILIESTKPFPRIPGGEKSEAAILTAYDRNRRHAAPRHREPVIGRFMNLEKLGLAVRAAKVTRNNLEALWHYFSGQRSILQMTRNVPLTFGISFPDSAIPVSLHNPSESVKR